MSNHTQRYYSFTDWKIIKKDRELVHQFSEDVQKYIIYGYDSYEMHICNVFKNEVPYAIIDSGYSQEQNDIDKQDFLDNYKDTANRILKTNVVTLFENDDKILKIVCSEALVDVDTGIARARIRTPGEFNGMELGISNGRWIDGGEAYFSEVNIGDKVTEINAIDVDGILGMGENVVVASYHDDEAAEENKGWFVLPRGRGSISVDTIGGYGWIASGLYLEIVGKKIDTNKTGSLYVNIKWGK